MQDNQTINKARALYYNLFANFFVESSKSENYFELLRLIKKKKKNAPIPTSAISATQP